MSAAAEPARGHPGRVGEEVPDLAEDPERHAQRAGEELAEEVLARHGLRRLVHARDHLGVERWRLGRVALEIEELQRQLHAGLAVGDRVVQLLDQCRLAAAQALDDRELPQRAGAIERVGRDQAGEVEELAHRAGLRQRDPAHVVVDVEVWVVDPHRRGEVRRHRLHPLSQPLEHVRGSLDALDELVEAGWPVEHRDVGERARQVRVLLDPPHQPLGVAHLAIEPRHVPHRLRRLAREPSRRRAGDRPRTPSASTPSASPNAAPATTSEGWWMRTNGAARGDDERDEVPDRRRRPADPRRQQRGREHAGGRVPAGEARGARLADLEPVVAGHRRPRATEQPLHALVDDEALGEHQQLEPHARAQTSPVDAETHRRGRAPARSG